MVVNNGVIIQFGLVSDNKQRTLPISYKKYYSLCTGGNKSSTGSNTTTLNDVSYYAVTIPSKSLTAFTCRGYGYFIACGI